uniref:HNH nuclease domain-containing protein n=1 Tax=Caulobacter phage BL57 TaxID=3348355 RepID=A0AB74UGY9_9VIRU
MHNVLYQEAFGDLPPGVLVRHRCDNRMCINLDHMIQGTSKDNSGDMVVRGRQGFQYGEAHSHAKLSTVQVQEVRDAIGTQREIAERFSIHQSQVSRIRSGKRRRRE